MTAERLADLRSQKLIVDSKPFYWKKLSVSFRDLNNSMVDGKRFYQTPYGNLPSVTTVLSVIPKPEIDAWKKAVGKQAAKQTSDIALKYGDSLHNCLQDYLCNHKVEIDNFLTAAAFKRVKEHLDLHVDNIYAVEVPLFSKYLQVAGRVDCVAEYDGKISIVDFKTAKTRRSEQDIQSYFMQAAAYAVMFEEQTGIAIQQLVILMDVEFEGCVVFKKKRDDYIWQFIEAKNEFYKTLN